MTTRSSPIQTLQAQADRIAKTLKDAPLSARKKDTFKAGIVMDDKVIILEMAWDTIDRTSQSDLAKRVLDQMQESAQ